MRLEKLSTENFVDFISLFESHECDKCYCMAWHRKSWDDFNPTIEQNLNDRKRMVDDGICDGFLVYDKDFFIGWVQVARAILLQNLVDMYNDIIFANEYAITCFKIKKEHRNQGYATSIVRLVIEEITKTDPQSIYGFPNNDQLFDENEKWNGTKNMFINNGFREMEKRQHYTIMKFDINPQQCDTPALTVPAR